MIRLDFRTEWAIDRVMKDVRLANIDSLGKAGQMLMRVARAMIVTSKKPSRPGTPPHSRRGQLRRAIRYEVERAGVVVGPTAQMLGIAGTAHEFGGYYRGGTYPERPFMGPALERVIDRLPSHWEASVRD